MLQIMEDLSSHGILKGLVLQNHYKYRITAWAFHPAIRSSHFMDILISEM